MDPIRADRTLGLAAGDWVGQYRIVKRLGAGGMGEVYLADDQGLDRQVALKKLSETGEEARKQIMREARAAARLNHPNVAQVYHVLEADGCIVMEYVRGETLAARLSSGRPLEPETAVAIAIQLADALSQAHKMGVLHRDLKPANVILTPEGGVKVLDFGLAKIQDPNLAGSDSTSVPLDQSSERTQLAGTPCFVAPERFRDEPADKRSDVYSLGVTLFVMLTGRRPFKGNLYEAGLAAMRRPPPRVRETATTVSEGIDAIVARAMAQEPEDRFQSADEFAKALRGVDGVPASEPEPTVALRPSAEAKAEPALPRRLVFGAAGGVVVLAVTYGVFQLLGRSDVHATHSAVVAVLPFASNSTDRTADVVAAGFADVLISTLAQIPDVTMVSRDATLEFRQRESDATAIARELGADLVVDGTVQTSGDDVRVTLSLLRPGSNRVVWSRSYDGDLGTLFTMQSEVALATSQALQVTLTPEQRQRLQRPPPSTSVDALAEYAQARYFLERPESSENLERSISLFESAIARDPSFARAHAGLGEASWKMFLRTRDHQWSEKAVLATMESLRLDPEDASVHRTLALLHAGRGKTEEATAELRRAIALEPDNDEAHRALGQLLLDQSHKSEAFAELRAAVARRPNYWRHHNALGLALFNEGRNQEAALAFQRVTELQPDNPWGFSGLGMVRYVMGDTAQAIELLERAIALGNDSSGPTNLGLVLYAEGRFEEAIRAFEEAVRLSPMEPSKHRNLGDAYERTGEREKAAQAYARAVELCQEKLRTNPLDARTLGQLAVYEAKLGAFDDAVRHVEEAVALIPQTAELRYRKAVVLAIAERTDESLVALEEALERGYSPRLAREDDDLGVLRGRPEFESLTRPEVTGRVKGGGK